MSVKQATLDPLDESAINFIWPRTLQSFHLDQTRKRFIAPYTEEYTCRLEMWNEEAEAPAEARSETIQRTVKAVAEEATNKARERAVWKVHEVVPGESDDEPAEVAVVPVTSAKLQKFNIKDKAS